MKSSGPQSTSPSICSTARTTIGPRQITGVSTSSTKPSDINRMPYFSNGVSRLPATAGRSEMPNIIGTDGP